ncbi:MAG: WecB/TagA/CpsF family glycosyltransferase [Planctomycetaceae bacterium]
MTVTTTPPPPAHAGGSPSTHAGGSPSAVKSAQIRLFGLTIDVLTMRGAVAKLMDWIAAPDGECRYVVTPNVDHVVMAQHHEGLRKAYADSALVLADGMPVVWASRLLGKRLPERVAGADLVPALFDAADDSRKLTVYLLGAAPGVAERARREIESRWPAVEVVGVYSPPLGFEKDDAENANILARIAQADPDVLVLGLGAPKQELWIQEHRELVSARVALCVGATIDFLAGEKPRAPRWMRRTGLEWVHRLCSEPRRLLKRYARDAREFPRLVWREFVHRRVENDLRKE